MQRLIAAIVVCSLRALAAGTSCDSLATLKIEHTEITTAQLVAAGAFTQPGRGGGNAFATLPAFCRVAGAIHPTTDSDIRFEVWMPAGNWNGRFQGVGNGGLAGTISYPAMAAALRQGYTTGSTDTGHVQEPGTAQWALHHPEKIRDFGHRAVHEMTLKSKDILTAFYGSSARKSYWNGCSEGGNQALSEAQRYPTDYDGILAGAPANYLTHLQAGGNWIAQAIHSDPATFIPATKLAAISRAVLAACDSADGVADGVLEDPRTCRFDPAVLACSDGVDTPDCLTAPQIAGLKKVYDGAKNPRTGDVVFPGHMRGGELGWSAWIVGADVPPRNTQHTIQLPFFRYFVFDNPEWDWKTFDFDKDVALADKKVGGDVNQINPDLAKFKDRGGKLIQYHGWSDPAISPINSVNYFTSVQKKMGDTQAFYRLFMLPGVGHCGGGPGPADFDRMSVVVDWVEEGKAPEQIVAAHVSNGQPDRTRPLCQYPKVAKYKGTGSTDDAANFSCVLP